MRIVVMGRTASGTAAIEESSPNWVRLPDLPGVELVELWGAGPNPKLPVRLSQAKSNASQPPAPGATSFRLVRVEPGREMTMHATNTIDYLVVLAGEIVLEPEGGSGLLLQATDCVVQLGGRHAWHNRGSVTCLLAAVIVGALAARADTGPAKRNSKRRRAGQ